MACGRRVDVISPPHPCLCCKPFIFVLARRTGASRGLQGQGAGCRGSLGRPAELTGRGPHFRLHLPPAMPQRCSNPACTAAATFTCSRCHAAGYCGAPCQRAHWRAHREKIQHTTLSPAARAEAIIASLQESMFRRWMPARDAKAASVMVAWVHSSSCPGLECPPGAQRLRP